MVRILAAVGFVAGVALAAPAAHAQKAPGPEPGVQREEGVYSGVEPGEPAGKGAQPVGKPGTLTWVGYLAPEADGGPGGRIFLQSPGAFEVTQRVEGRVVILHLAGIKRLARNVRRPLDLRFFDTGVARATVAKVSARRATKTRPARKGGYELRLEMKDAATAAELTTRTATEADGFFYVYVDVPPGAAASSSSSSSAPLSAPPTADDPADLPD